MQLRDAECRGGSEHTDRFWRASAAHWDRRAGLRARGGQRGVVQRRPLPGAHKREPRAGRPVRRSAATAALRVSSAQLHMQWLLRLQLHC